MKISRSGQFPVTLSVAGQGTACLWQNNPGRSQEPMLDISGLSDPLSARAHAAQHGHSHGPCAWLNFQRFGCPKNFAGLTQNCDPLGLHFLPVWAPWTPNICITPSGWLLSWCVWLCHSSHSRSTKCTRIEINYSTTRPVIVMQSCMSASQKSDMLANKHENLGGPQCYFFRK